MDSDRKPTLNLALCSTVISSNHTQTDAEPRVGVAMIIEYAKSHVQEKKDMM